MATQSGTVLSRQENVKLLASLPEPKAIWQYFLLCTEYPRLSVSEGGDMKPFVDRLCALATSWGCEPHLDSEGNLLIRKKASPGCERAPGVVIQCHADMVCSANADKLATFDFKKHPIDCRIDGDYLKANGTTLGADDGIGVAACLALLADPHAVHGPLECLFTKDEETTMSGAENLAGPPFIKSTIMINVDSEEEHAICIGCAGGYEVTLTQPLVRHNPQAGWKSFDVGIKGLLGGHTGIDIHKPRGNAIKLLAEILQQWNRERGGLQLVSFEGGAALNTIPRAASARVVLPSEQEATAFKASVTAAYEVVRAQFKLAEPQMEFTLTPNAQPLADKAVCDPATSAKLLDVVLVLPHGVHRMHPDIEHEVESSISFSKIVLDARTASFFFFGRSSSESQMQRSLEQVQAFARLAGLGSSGRHNSFPAWQPDTQSRTLRILQRQANLLWPNGVRIYSVHAGLECGWVLGKYPAMDCVSIGPQIDNAHTPDERLLIPSVPRFWTLLTSTLAAIGKELQA